jgi:hypothetical protein
MLQLKCCAPPFHPTHSTGEMYTHTRAPRGGALARWRTVLAQATATRLRGAGTPWGRCCGGARLGSRPAHNITLPGRAWIKPAPSSGPSSQPPPRATSRPRAALQQTDRHTLWGPHRARVAHSAAARARGLAGGGGRVGTRAPTSAPSARSAPRLLDTTPSRGLAAHSQLALRTPLAPGSPPPSPHSTQHAALLPCPRGPRVGRGGGRLGAALGRGAAGRGCA